MRRVALLGFLGAIAAASVALSVVEWKRVQERETVSEIEARLNSALPAGSTEAAIIGYLGTVGWSSDSYVVQANELDSDLVRADIDAGIRVVVSSVYQSPTLFWLSERDIRIIFVLGAAGTLDRIVLFPHDFFI